MEMCGRAMSLAPIKICNLQPLKNPFIILKISNKYKLYKFLSTLTLLDTLTIKYLGVVSLW